MNIAIESVNGTVVDITKYVKSVTVHETVYIHYCDAAWKLYDLRKWKALDKHRETCTECWRKVVVNE